ncbi:PqqD family peptide modification chaperone [Kitasatospora sp. NPDC002227]|uniref:PqqD family peptide modification chaperone n=1 Tax=Kitasatospora sp. NPDC002227 TaxID=3154773 RepID=UPI0033292F9E
MLVSPAGRYLNISPSGLAILRALGEGMTGAELMTSLADRFPAQEESIRTVVPDFLTDLRRAEVLNLEPPARAGTDRVTRLSKLDLVKRFPLLAEPGRLAGPVARLLALVPVRLLCALLLAVPAVALPLAVLALTSGAGAGRPEPWMPAVAIGAMLVQVLLHESCHAVAMCYNRVPPRDAGVGLMFYLLPIAYVDRTNSYRHQGRFGRVLISLVGPINDLFWAGVSATVVLTCGGEPAQFCRMLLVFQLLSLITNLNPLFPTDGYHAIEAAVGAINMRGRALAFVLHRLARKPLPLYLRSLSRRARAGYLVYITVSLLLAATTGLAILVNLAWLVVGLAS